MMAQGVRVKVTSVKNKNNDGGFSPENIGQISSTEGIQEGIERRVWALGELLGNCVIWCEGLPLWNLVTGVMGLMLEVIWGKEKRWRRQAQIWWPGTQCRDRGRELDLLYWKADWIFTEESQFTKAENEFWKRSKLQVI